MHLNSRMTRVFSRLVFACLFFALAAFHSPVASIDHFKAIDGIEQFNCVKYSDNSKANNSVGTPGKNTNSKCKSFHCLTSVFSDYEDENIYVFLKRSFYIENIAILTDISPIQKLILISAPRGPPEVMMLG